MITIEQLESLATELENDDAAQRDRLSRLCRAYVRILAVREPERFERGACHYGDTVGSCDGSYPPGQEYSERTGPRSIALINSDTENVATSTGFYYTWRRVTKYGGLEVGRDCRWYRSDEYGTGRFGQFPAHPGTCNVDVTIDWHSVAQADLTTAELALAEVALRELAFPLTAAKLAE